MIEEAPDFLRGNAYHESGHAIVGWALNLCVGEITIRDDRPGENVKIAGAERLPLIDRIALHNAGRQAEEIFRHLLPSWASSGDRTNAINEIVAEGFSDTPDIEQWIADGCARARQVIEGHEREVHQLAAHLIECRHMDADAFERFMLGADV